MDKINILVFNVNNAGVGKFRFKDPHIMLQKNFKSEYHIDFTEKLPTVKEEYQKYHMVFMQSSMLADQKIYDTLIELKKDGLKIVIDIDDYWLLPMSHAMYYEMRNRWKVIMDRVKLADLVTTTTKHLAGVIKKYNKSVVILPNAIDPNEKQFQPNPTPSEFVRLGFIGGSSHLEDVKLIRNLTNQMINYKGNKVQMVMCGFNNQQRDIKTGKVTNVDKPKVWMEYEYIFTAGFIYLDEDYKHYLLNPRKERYEGDVNKRYRRIWTKPIQEYGLCYNEVDIALAPLEDIPFNRMKSQLKIIEAGFHKKPIIVSDVAPYQIDCINKQNAFLVEKKKAHKLFPKYAKTLIDDKNLREDMGMALYETVKDKYNLVNVTKQRNKIYKSLF